MLDTTWIQPPFDIVRAAHAELIVTDLQRAKEFYVHLLGLVVSEERQNVIYLRGYEERLHHSLALRQGPVAMLDHLAFRVASPEHLVLLARFYEQQGCPVRWVQNEEEGMEQALRVQDPCGFIVEFFYFMQPVESLLRRYDLYRGSHIQRIDHFNLHVPDVQSAFDYYKQLGFRCSEYTVTSSPDKQLWAAWLYRKPTIHDVALTNGTGPRLHHLGFWVSEAQDILHTCDRFAAAGQNMAIERGPGRHGVSNAFFLYLRDPDDFRIELYTCDYFTGDPDFEPMRWTVDDPRRGTFWGHIAPVSWFEESSLVKGLDGKPAQLQLASLKERPMTVI
ncbi:3,4-dihydroxyphenylacetate 2,3-dioxygenase [Ktedonosporobacter rubrisoli]|uniref:3,4-dihydroxyphenylacetate 2,3-dioxygenase n=1 Tax=Ktedonosporobacter rubrisoli TaxID=2509675 RepID=A0A4P6JP18_KTERU|nr:3,4-dihydroxyphenylacetate 2,3-dioxygenase [Ktedonosporobacter rubrisoli]QBD77087.1 3,4-dihydroxyphenylacetate 2,3-dioxygenase [Ktedonosporobacter rubrisoli]